MAEGRLPNLSRLQQQGSFHRLRTTFPALSPVAWSTFATGVSPAKHNIFDFLSRSLDRTCPNSPRRGCARAARILKIGRWRIPFSRPIIEFRRKSRTFWSILGERAITSTILRVPITFPPEKFDGRMLSAMCTPDLRGTQGSFSQFTTRLEQAILRGRRPLSAAPFRRRTDRLARGPGRRFRGPRSAGDPVQDQGFARVRIARRSRSRRAYPLRRGEYSPWIRLAFHALPGDHRARHRPFHGHGNRARVLRLLSPLSRSIPKLRRCRSAIPPITPSTWPNCSAPTPRREWPRTPGHLNEGVIDEAAFPRSGVPHDVRTRVDVRKRACAYQRTASWPAFSTPATACSTCSSATWTDMAASGSRT